MELVDDEGVMAGKSLAKGVDRAGADIAIDYADRGKGELAKRSLSVTLSMIFRRLRFRATRSRNAHSVAICLPRDGA